MFFNRQDIDWFKPVELSSKYGRRGKKEHLQFDVFFFTFTLALALLQFHSEPEWNIGIKNCLALNTAQIYDFCIPLDLLDTKDLKKTSKGQKKF